MWHFNVKSSCLLSLSLSLLQVSPVSGQNKFSIISSSGQLSLSQSLDYEGVKEYQLTIEAYVSLKDNNCDL